MGYQINGMEVEDYIDRLNKNNLKNTIFGMTLAFFTGMFIGIIIESK